MKNPSENLIIKITEDHQNFAKEIATLRRVDRFSETSPEVVGYGLIKFKDKLYAWVIMPRYGMNLETYLKSVKRKISKSSIYDIGRALLKTLEATHKAGYVNNDLKLENILVGYNQIISKQINNESVFEGLSIHLIDFGYATKFRDSKTGTHIS